MASAALTRMTSCSDVVAPSSPQPGTRRIDPDSRAVYRPWRAWSARAGQLRRRPRTTKATPPSLGRRQIGDRLLSRSLGESSKTGAARKFRKRGTCWISGMPASRAARASRNAFVGSVMVLPSLPSRHARGRHVSLTCAVSAIAFAPPRGSPCLHGRGACNPRTQAAR